MALLTLSELTVFDYDVERRLPFKLYNASKNWKNHTKFGFLAFDLSFCGN